MSPHLLIALCVVGVVMAGTARRGRRHRRAFLESERHNLRPHLASLGRRRRARHARQDAEATEVAAWLRGMRDAAGGPPDQGWPRALAAFREAQNPPAELEPGNKPDTSDGGE